MGRMVPMPDVTPTCPILALRRGDAARALGVSVRTFDSMVSDGRLGPPGLRLSRDIHVWPVDELRAWLAAGAPPRETWIQETAQGLPRRVETDGHTSLDRRNALSQRTGEPLRLRR
jgi:predicted DNA-binding transcriptional regulator AlpA